MGDFLPTRSTTFRLPSLMKAEVTKKHVAGNSGRLSAFAVRRDFFLLYIILESSQCILIYNDEM